MNQGDRTTVPMPSGYLYDKLPLNLKPGDLIGQYHLVRLLGDRSSFGVVWLAEQKNTGMKVAVKVLKSSEDTARVDKEREALIRLEHEYVARIFDAGLTPHGHAYFVMQFIDGCAITGFCDQRMLSVRERLRMFIKVCQGVQHAHNKRIIHRDIKPDNVLVCEVDGELVPKVVDFGLATDAPAGEPAAMPGAASSADPWRRYGTIEYMSPQQIRRKPGDDDARDDIYSLGALLYELLIGLSPFDSDQVRGVPWATVEHLICEVGPRPPTLRFGDLDAAVQVTTAGLRKATAKSLPRRLHGDLEWIIARAMARPREERYGSAAELAADVERHMRNERIPGAPLGLAGRFAKMLRRNPKLVATMTALVVTMAVVAVIALRLAAVSRDRLLKAEEAQRQGELTNRAVEFLAGVLEQSRADLGGRDMTVVEALAFAVDDAKRQFASEPEILATVLQRIGLTYWSQRRIDEASRLIGEALELRKQRLGWDDPKTIDARLQMGALLIDLGRFNQAIDMLREAVASNRRVRGGMDENTLVGMMTLARAFQVAGEVAPLRPLYEELIPKFEKVFGPGNEQTIALKHNFGQLLLDLMDYGAALPFLRQVVETHEAAGEAGKPFLGFAYDAYAQALEKNDRPKEACPYFEKALAIRTETLGSDADFTLITSSNYGDLLRRFGEYDRAEPLLEKAAARLPAIRGASDRDTLMARMNLAMLLYDRQRRDEARDLFERLIPDLEVGLGADHQTTREAVSLLKELSAGGKQAESKPVSKPES